jgi:hypothetical protein
VADVAPTDAAVDRDGRPTGEDPALRGRPRDDDHEREMNERLDAFATWSVILGGLCWAAAFIVGDIAEAAGGMVAETFGIALAPLAYALAAGLPLAFSAVSIVLGGFAVQSTDSLIRVRAMVGMFLAGALLVVVGLLCAVGVFFFVTGF